MNSNSKYNDITKGVNSLLQGLRVQLDDILITYQVTALQRFLVKLTAQTKNLFVELFQGQKGQIQHEDIIFIFDELWGLILEPIWQWFSKWRDMLFFQGKIDKTKYVQFGRMKRSLRRSFKLIHRFYYWIIEYIVSRYDTRLIIPKIVVSQLNLSPTASSTPVKLEKIEQSGNITVLIVTTFHCSLNYLGLTHYHMSLIEKTSNVYLKDDFKKSERYIDLAITLLPSMGVSYANKAMVSLRYNDFTSTIFEAIRGSLIRLPDLNYCTKIYADLILSYDTATNKQYNRLFLETSRNTSENSPDQQQRKILRSYFLAILGSYLAPDIWSDEANPEYLKNNFKISQIETYFFDSLATSTTFADLDIIFKYLIIIIGSTHLQLFYHNGDFGTITHLKELSKQELSFLKFTFKFITMLLKNVILGKWEKYFKEYQYLAMVRVINCWIKSNIAILKFAHRDESFCQAMAELLNDIFESKYSNHLYKISKRPTRAGYFFQEDILLKEFSCVNFALTDFNDVELFRMPDLLNRIVWPPVGYRNENVEKSGNEVENMWRLEVVVVSGMKFLKNGPSGIRWNEAVAQYQWSKEEMSNAHDPISLLKLGKIMEDKTLKNQGTSRSHKSTRGLSISKPKLA